MVSTVFTHDPSENGNGHASNGYTSPSTLTRLSEVIAENALIIDAENKKAKVPFLSIDEPKPHVSEIGDFRFLPSQEEIVARNKLISACETAANVAGNAVTRIGTMALGYLNTASLYFAVKGNIPDVLAKLDPKGQGVPAETIASEINTSPEKLKKVLRYLTSQNIFSETEEGFFANNRYSIQLVDSSPLKASVELCHELNFLPATQLANYMYSPTVFNDEGTKPDGTPGLAHALAFNTQQGFFQWMNDPAQANIRSIFNRAMGQKNLDTTPGIVADLPWDAIARKGGKIVDVGGGVGSLALMIVKHNPELTAVVQDQAGMIAMAKGIWAQQLPNAKVDLQVHDFFTPNPVVDADIYFLRAVLHNWDDAHSRKILDNMLPVFKQRAQGQTPPRVFVIDNVIEPALKGKKTAVSDGSDVIPQQPTSELRHHEGMDLTMFALGPAYERTRSDWERCMKLAGWKIVQEWPIRSFKQCIEIAPIA